jgi:hypothetical protein
MEAAREILLNSWFGYELFDENFPDAQETLDELEVAQLTSAAV